MFIKILLILFIILFSGCTATKNEQYHQQTILAIQNIDTSFKTKIDLVNSNIEQQHTQIENLEKKLQNLEKAFKDMKQEALAKKSIVKEVKPTPPPTPTLVVNTTKNDTVLGGVELVQIDSIKQLFKARIDTGASISSLNAVDIEQFERNGKKWVRFYLVDKETKENETNLVETPIVRFVNVRQSSSTEAQNRIVVELWVKLGDIHEKAEFSLANRSQMSYPVLLGREFIKDIAVVDVSKKYVQSKKEK